MSERQTDPQGGNLVAPVVKHADSVAASVVPAGRGTSTRVLLGPEDGARNFHMRRFTMVEDGGMPLHTNAVEHEQYVLRGRARIRIGETVHEVGPDDVLLIPAGAPHSYEVVKAPFEFLCLVPNAPDRIEIL